MTFSKSVDFELSENYIMKDDVNNKGASGVSFGYVCLNLTLIRLWIVVVQLMNEFKLIISSEIGINLWLAPTNFRAIPIK